VGWSLEFEGEVYREGDLTLGQCERIEEAIGRSWAVINPVTSAKQARVVLEVVAADRLGQTADEVRKRVEALKVDEFLAGYKLNEDEDDRPTEYVDGNPQPAGEPSTPG
jgi:hypothetical protein